MKTKKSVKLNRIGSAKVITNKDLEKNAADILIERSRLHLTQIQINVKSQLLSIKNEINDQILSLENLLLSLEFDDIAEKITEMDQIKDLHRCLSFVLNDSSVRIWNSDIMKPRKYTKKVKK